MEEQSRPSAWLGCQDMGFKNGCGVVLGVCVHGICSAGPFAAAILLLTLFPLSGKTRRGSRGGGADGGWMSSLSGFIIPHYRRQRRHRRRVHAVQR